MKSRLLILTLLLVSGCAKPRPDPRDIRSTDPELVPYVHNFESYLGHPVGDVPVAFVALPSPSVGLCVVYSTGEKEIKIDPTYWSHIGFDERTALVFHELGHCVLGRDHTSEILHSNVYGDVPVSFMYPYSFYNSHYADKGLWNYYVNELFTPSMVIKFKLANSDKDCVTYKEVKNE